MKKKISVCIPCYNEEENIHLIVTELKKVFNNELINYDCSIMFIDNHSTDETREIIRQEVSNGGVRAIFNAKNFPMTSGYYGLLNAGGDCTISIPADFQIPINIIPKLVNEWEQGAAIVCAVKEGTESSKIMWKVRQIFYGIYEKLANGEIISNYTGAGLYDKKFIRILREMNDPVPSLMAMVMSHGWNVKKVFYKENKRRNGKTKNNFLSLINIAILRITNTSIIIPRLSMIAGILVSILSFIGIIIYICISLLFRKGFIAGIIPILFAIFFMGAVQLIFLGVIGEYIIKINTRVSKIPLVIEEERLGFQDEEQ